MLGASSHPTTEAEHVGELYRALAARLEQLVRLGVRAPDPVIEDACQTAWSRLVHRRGAVRTEATLQWLASTAVREALRLLRRAGRELSLDAVTERSGEPGGWREVASAHDVTEQHERLATVAVLPVRQQRLLWLQAIGLSYGEMALHEGCTLRTVERQLLRAKRKVRELAGE